MKNNLSKIHIPKSGSSLKVGRKYVRYFGWLSGYRSELRL